MKSMTDILTGIVGLIAIAVAVWQALLFLGAKDPRTGVPDMMYGLNHLWWAILAAVVAVGSIVIYYVRHPRTEEEIHVTK
ncbi:MAG TPA: hypothetical protein VGB17_06815 [Pyrinomonadaceae bacterium]|jgi:hypothetical protein